MGFKASIVIPCFNEGLNLPLLIKRCQEIHKKNNILEFIFVNNGSTDNSKELLKNMSYNCIKVVNLQNNQGYGGGIIQGLKFAKNEIVGWTHADLQTDPEDLIRGIKCFEKNKDKLIFVKGRRHGRSLFENILTMGMSVFETLLFRKVMIDINAQPTLFNRDLLKLINNFPNDFTIDLYVFYIALRKKYIFKRFKVNFLNRKYGVSSWNRGILSALKQILNFIKQSLILYKKAKRNDY